MPLRIARPPAADMFDAAPDGYTPLYERLALFGWSRNNWSLNADLKALVDPIIIWAKVNGSARHAQMYIPGNIEIPLHPKLAAKKPEPAQAKETKPVSEGKRELKGTHDFNYTDVTTEGMAYMVVVIDGETLAQQYRVRRYKYDHGAGVNRILDDNRTLEIAESMQAGNSLVSTDNLVLHLEGKYRRKLGKLLLTNESILEVIDGQHRTLAVELLEPAQRRKWAFTAHIYVNLTHEQKLKLFFQQTLRKPIHTAMSLQLKAQLGQFSNSKEELCYRCCEIINTDERSPLKGLVDFDEPEYAAGGRKQLSAAGRVQTAPGHVTLSALMRILRTLYTKRSPLYGFNLEQLSNVLLWTLQAAKATWGTNWRDVTSPLRLSSGLEVIFLVHNQAQFCQALGMDYKRSGIMQAFQYGSGFRWNVDKTKIAIQAMRRPIGNSASAPELLAQAIHRGLMKSR